MKKIILTLLIAAFPTLYIAAQDNCIPLSYLKTTTITFDHDVQTVDRGSDGYMVKKLDGMPRALLLKAAYTGFEESNLTVRTANGSLFQLNICYNQQPDTLYFHLKEQQALEYDQAKLTLGQAMESLINRSYPSFKKCVEQGIEVKYPRLKVFNEYMLMHMKINNHTSIPWDLASVRLYIKSRQKLKRVSYQEQEIPVKSLITNHTKDAINVVIAFPNQVLTKGKMLHVEVMGNSNQRNLKIKLTPAQLLEANLLIP
ncbi:DUF4138 domain-containing protein [Fulvivirga ligni]|uniref:DUF4138 domain-containing protein n=1 Tax=Fulvivirga ligni TaxID=2904246 RepID=UPI001F41A95B|nr:DUF4138 domain-containing protein [Fulvivirga ligni]UII20798.1 conjugative transposon protein TraN [Fulvivirga ligni]